MFNDTPYSHIEADYDIFFLKSFTENHYMNTKELFIPICKFVYIVNIYARNCVLSFLNTADRLSVVESLYRCELNFAENEKLINFKLRAHFF